MVSECTHRVPFLEDTLLPQAVRVQNKNGFLKPANMAHHDWAVKRNKLELLHFWSEECGLEPLSCHSCVFEPDTLTI